MIIYDYILAIDLNKNHPVSSTAQIEDITAYERRSSTETATLDTVIISYDILRNNIIQRWNVERVKRYDVRSRLWSIFIDIKD